MAQLAIAGVPSVHGDAVLHMPMTMRLSTSSEKVAIYPFYLTLVLLMMLANLRTRRYQFLICQGILDGLSMRMTCALPVRSCRALLPVQTVCGHGYCGIRLHPQSNPLPYHARSPTQQDQSRFRPTQRILGFVVLGLQLWHALQSGPGVTRARACISCRVHPRHRSTHSSSLVCSL